MSFYACFMGVFYLNNCYCYYLILYVLRDTGSSSKSCSLGCVQIFKEDFTRIKNILTFEPFF